MCRSVYETPLPDAEIVADLHAVDTTGERLAVTRVRPDRIELRSAAANADVVLAGEESVVVLAGPGVRVGWRSIEPSMPVSGMEDPRGRIVVLGPICDSLARDLRSGSTSAIRAAVLKRSRRWWQGWYATIAPQRQGSSAAYLHAWWALAVNQVRLRRDADRVAVVPSKVGYLGLWQWDAYFIAVGLRHGHTDLALDQIELALRHQRPNGLLPDVVHDEGVLDNVEHLPASDNARLAEHVGSRIDAVTGAAAPGVTALGVAVPVTKPPLAAWALLKVLDAANEQGRALASPPAAFARQAAHRLSRAQDWWFAVSDPAGTGLPRYLHPYSSGIDDCPVWDFGTDVDTPDLGAYLALNADALATIAGRAGSEQEARRRRAQADVVTRRLLDRLWDHGEGRFAHRSADGSVLPTRTALELMPLLTGRLPQEAIASLARLVEDPTVFGGPWRITTAARQDPAFDASQMWRGPIWVNTNYLVVQGLRRSGLHEVADRLAAATIALVDASPTIAEYWDPNSGAPAQAATAPFSWSAALYIDLAVTEGR